LALDLPSGLRDNLNGMKAFLATLTICMFPILAGCSAEQLQSIRPTSSSDSESIPIENSTLKNCRFQSTNPTYPFGSVIQANPIVCDEGVPKKVELLTPSPLPSGVQFSIEQLSLIGTANERVIQAPYEFYLENESGYTTIKIQISIQ
jgi:hypothetical protein